MFSFDECWLFGFRIEMAGAARWRWLAAIPSVLGFSVALRCVWDFARTGRGSPAPFAPPKQLVVVCFYRHVRNPMYLGFFIGWAGLWVVFGRLSTEATVLTVLAIIAVDLFVLFYEEPRLRRVFGAEYEAYCLNVRRWIPRLHPWIQPK